MKNKGKCRLARSLKFIYIKFFRMNDTPQKIAQGFGLGVFLGILPATGIIAALCLAFVFKVNRASAILGSILTNTWLSFLIFPLSIQIGSTIMDLNWRDVYSSWMGLLRDFHFRGLFKLSILKIALPVAIGYLIIAFCLGLFTYFAVLIILKQIKKHKKAI
ncbi:MAG: DUF2062 domain-containing protein [Candidatus Omnitrophica bacterium]|nr:DUF2062 domain-containing protein [Candidatus Omnitrophota bacterium]